MALSIAKLSIAITANTKGLRKGLRSGRKQINAFGSKVAAAAAQVAKLSAATTALGGTGLALASRQAGRFEQAMARVKGITNATAKDFKRLENQARALGRTTVFTAGQAAQAQAVFALANFKTNEILKAMPSTLNLAAAGQLDVAEAADIAAGIMGGMGLTADQVGGAMEVLARGFTTAKTNIRELGEAFKFVGPIGRFAGKDLEELTATLQVFAKSSIQGGEAGTALRKLLIRLQAPPADARRALDKLKVKIFDTSGEMKNMATIVDDVNKGLSTLSQQEKIVAINALAGVKAIGALAAILDAGGDALRSNEAALRAQGNTLERIAKVQVDTLFGAFKRITSATEGLGISIGKMVNKFLRPMAEQLAKAFNIIEDFFNRNADIISVLVKQLAEVGVEMLNVFGILTAGNAILDTFGATGATAFERLSNALATLETGLRNTDLAFQFLETVAVLALTTVEQSFIHFFMSTLPTVLGNALRVVGNFFFAFQQAMSKAFEFGIILGQNFANLILGRISGAELRAKMADIGLQIAKDLGETLVDGLKPIAPRVLTELEEGLLDKLDNLGVAFGNELGKSLFKGTKGLEVDPPKVDADTQKAEAKIRKLGDQVRRALRLPKALEFGTQAAITAERDPVAEALKSAGLPGMKAATKATEGVEKNTADLVEKGSEQITLLDSIDRKLGAQPMVFSLVGG